MYYVLLGGTIFSMIMTLGVLAKGVIGMYKGGAENRENSNRLMRLRVMWQFITILFFTALIYFYKGG